MLRPAPQEEVIEDAARIHKLVQSELEFVGATDGGWSRLFRDKADGRFWEHTYPHSELHGGGPPRLAVISRDEAQQRYSA
jgi:hypothetical protein